MLLKQNLAELVLAGRLDEANQGHVTLHHASVAGDDILRPFWEIEGHPNDKTCLSSKERSVLHHFKDKHYHNLVVVFLPTKCRTTWRIPLPSCKEISVP